MSINRYKSLLTIVLATAVLSIGSGHVRAASIGVYSSQDCSNCNLEIPIGQTRTLYINVITEGLGPFNVIGGHFAVSGLPASWTTSIIEDQSVLVLGDPFEDSGVDIAFSAPRSGPCVNLLSVDVTATSAESDEILSVVAVSPPLSPSFDCLIVKTDCVFCVPLLCVSGGSLLLNSSSSCTVSAAQRTWGAVKRLFDSGS